MASVETTLSWNASPHLASGHTVAVLEMTRPQWEAAGATFVDVSGSGQHDVHIAAGSIMASGRPVSFGVLDYGQSTTYLVTESSAQSRTVATLEILRALIANHAISAQAVRATDGEKLSALSELTSGPTGSAARSGFKHGVRTIGRLLAAARLRSSQP